jgi:hypothetical protein
MAPRGSAQPPQPPEIQQFRTIAEIETTIINAIPHIRRIGRLVFATWVSCG